MSSASFAQVRVAFFEMKDPTGVRVELEPGGQFFHVALQLKDGSWIHTHPYYGVQVVEDLRKIGEPKSMLASALWREIDREKIFHELGKPFDFKFRWFDPETTYCSKLVGQLLGLSPLPSSFSGAIWKSLDLDATNPVGLSPDDLFYLLLSNGFKIERPRSCESQLSS